MGSQTLEILRQGVWASLTGGWFYDPHQDVFCNTFHLYVWLLLLCLPFTIYVYFPPTKYMWYFYCISVTVVLTIIKLLNYGLHHMYDTTTCVKEEREDEGIEMQDLSSKPSNNDNSTQRLPSLASYAETSLLPAAEIESVASTDDHQIDAVEAGKASGTIDLKAEVHRKNSTDSSDEGIPVVVEVNNRRETREKERRTKKSERKKHQRSKTDSFVNVTINNERKQRHSLQKRFPQGQGSIDSTENGYLRPSLTSIELEQGAVGDSRRHGNLALLGFFPRNDQEMKPTGSLELGYIDKEANQGFNFKNSRGGVRRIRSTALETCCSVPPLSVHPNSLEMIGCKSRNPLPPPSSSLTRNQHLNLCPYYGSEIVYPIAEQSDEHQTSHGPDTDLESLTHNSDSDFEESISHAYPSPFYYIRLRKPPYCENFQQRPQEEERNSATSKDALLDNDNSNSSEPTEKVECYATDNDISEKKLEDVSNFSCSNTSVDCDERTSNNNSSFKRKTVLRLPVRKSVDILPEQASKIEKCLEDCRASTSSDWRNDSFVERHGHIVRKPNVRRHKRRKLSDKTEKDNCSSLIELDLDWLFDNENQHLPLRKEPLKRDTEWSSTTTVSLEHDVNKVLQEDTAPSTRSLGAIPKKMKEMSSQHESSSRKTTKNDKCKICRCTSEEKYIKPTSSKENKVTQTLRQCDSPNNVEGLECLVLPSQRFDSASVSRRIVKTANPSISTANISNNNNAEEASSSSSNNELSTLLPPAPLLSPFMSSRTFYVRHPNIEAAPRPPRLKRNKHNRRRSHMHRSRRDNAIATSLSAGHGTHCAKNFNDTTDGALHCFMDEYGNWVTYTFDEKGIGTANNRIPLPPAENQVVTKAASRRLNEAAASTSKIWDSNSTESVCNSAVSVSVIQEAPPPKPPADETPRNLNLKDIDLTDLSKLNELYFGVPPEELQRQILQRVKDSTTNQREVDALLTFLTIQNEFGRRETKFKFIKNSSTPGFKKTKTYYKFKLWSWAELKVTLDRLKLLALLDRNLTFSETLVAIILGVLVGILGATLLYLNFYEDLLAFIFCFVMASCQYSLLKSVQPDAASPTHGFNRVIAYSRPIYFCIFSSLILLIHINIEPAEVDYSISVLSSQGVFSTVKDFLIKFILFFPILFSLGLFPQVNTFLLYLNEQIDMHIFGGNAIPSLIASIYCLFRSIFAVLVLTGLCYGGLVESKRSQHILFSMFCACLVSCSYHLSRGASDPSFLWNILKKHLWPPDIYKEHKKHINEKLANKDDKSLDDKPDKSDKDSVNTIVDKDPVDPLPEKLRKTVNARLKNDIILCGLIAILVFAIHASTVFTVLQPELSPVLWSIAAALGFVLHYIFPQLRKQLPWMCIARPVFRSFEHGQFQTRGLAKIMWFERIFVYFCFLEKNILYPLLFISALTEDSPKVMDKYGPLYGSILVVICGLKCLRGSYSSQHCQYLIVTFTALFFKYDYNLLEETFLVEYFIMSIVFHKVYELLLKIQFVVTYIAPWQITWGSAFHAFAQPFSIPHSAMLFSQTVVSAVLSTPLNPFLGSTIFLTSYVRPVKFWERDYNTRRVDHSNTPLSSHLDRNLGADDNNLNSIFYEHLTRSLQHSLCGDLIMGRWGSVSQGDCFVLASDYLNCLVHIIELGNGLVTFQMRGLEFRGTYCQQREVEAITEGVEQNDGCCCCDTGHLPNMLSMNAAFSQRWLAWEVTASKYILEGYSISDNSAASMFQVFEFRKVLVSYYVKSIIFYTIRSPKLEEWLTSQTILKALQPMQDKSFVDLDPVFNFYIDEDYDMQNFGMTKHSFCNIHGDWVTYCVEKFGKNVDSTPNSILVVLCFALSLLARRTLGAVSHNTVCSVDLFLYGLHALFKGDFRITCARDEWVFTDMDLLKTVVAPGVRMSLKLHQDHFMSPDEYDDLPVLFDAICKHEEELVISHEGDPAWRNAILNGTPSLLALRHVLDDGSDDYKIIMLNKRFLSFRVIKINRECVRGLWAGQQQELVYLRNRNPERGSIQNAKQALRNIINSSCDQPIGYPIYVSPLTTSYAETNEQYCKIVGGSVSLTKIKNFVINLFLRIRKRCGEGCSSGASARDEIGMGHEGVYAMTPVTTLGQSTDGSHLGGSIGRGSSLSRTSLGGNRGSLVSVGKPTSSTLASLAGLFKEKDERSVSQAPDATIRGDERIGECYEEKEALRVKIIEPNFVYDGINLGRRIDVCWPTEYMRLRGGRSYWNNWVPEIGMEGYVVHKWTPGHRDPSRRSHVDRTILLLQIDDKFVPIADQGIIEISGDL